MSFKCDYCNQPQRTGTKPNKVVTATRDVSYRTPTGKMTTGTEIVKEVDLCRSCK